MNVNTAAEIPGRVQRFIYELLYDINRKPCRTETHGDFRRSQVNRLHGLQRRDVGPVSLRVLLRDA